MNSSSTSRFLSMMSRLRLRIASRAPSAITASISLGAELQIER